MAGGAEDEAGREAEVEAAEEEEAWVAEAAAVVALVEEEAEEAEEAAEVEEGRARSDAADERLHRRDLVGAAILVMKPRRGWRSHPHVPLAAASLGDERWRPRACSDATSASASADSSICCSRTPRRAQSVLRKARFPLLAASLAGQLAGSLANWLTIWLASWLLSEVLCSLDSQLGAMAACLAN